MNVPSGSVFVGGGTLTQTNHYHGHRGSALLRGAIAEGAFHDSRERFDPPKCHPGTREAVLKTIMAWITDEQQEAFILWLFGPAGAGKSAVAQTIAEMCQEAGLLLASFFFSRTIPTRNNDKRLIATIAYQIALAIPTTRPLIEAAIERDPVILSRSL
ncbi:hypothetical protein B0H34DRAFT_796458 [Crassisporium funariophilum]|nr:hypothetical protein B0H34DRAFT_796458 [Crassisporium funariophilum]